MCILTQRFFHVIINTYNNLEYTYNNYNIQQFFIIIYIHLHVYVRIYLIYLARIRIRI